MFVWLFEGELEVALHCTQDWSVFSTVSAWKSGNRWWQDETDLIKKSHAMAPASAAASGHHLQELGSLTHEKDLGGVMKNLPCSVGYSSCSTISLFSHNRGKKCIYFHLNLLLPGPLQLLRSCSYSGKSTELGRGTTKSLLTLPLFGLTWH